MPQLLTISAANICQRFDFASNATEPPQDDVALAPDSGACSPAVRVVGVRFSTPQSGPLQAARHRHVPFLHRPFSEHARSEVQPATASSGSVRSRSRSSISQCHSCSDTPAVTRK